MTKKEIEEIGILIEKQDLVALNKLCKTLNLKEGNSFDDVAYAIMNEIEKNEELMNCFKELSKEQN